MTSEVEVAWAEVPKDLVVVSSFIMLQLNKNHNLELRCRDAQNMVVSSLIMLQLKNHSFEPRRTWLGLREAQNTNSGRKTQTARTWSPGLPR